IRRQQLPRAAPADLQNAGKAPLAKPPTTPPGRATTTPRTRSTRSVRRPPPAMRPANSRDDNRARPSLNLQAADVVAAHITSRCKQCQHTETAASRSVVSPLLDA